MMSNDKTNAKPMCPCGREACEAIGDPLEDHETACAVWNAAARRYLERLGAAEYATFRASKPRKRERFSPSEYHRTLIEHLNDGNEEAFKTEKMLRGRYSALGV